MSFSVHVHAHVAIPPSASAIRADDGALIGDTRVHLEVEPIPRQLIDLLPVALLVVE